MLLALISANTFSSAAHFALVPLVFPFFVLRERSLTFIACTVPRPVYGIRTISASGKDIPGCKSEI
jgi:hypothetical protein